MTQLECKSLQFGTGDWSCDYTAAFSQGGWHILCGSSGSGKSTLLHLLTGVLNPNSGEIKNGEKMISHLPPHERGLSFMSQANSLFPGITILENLLLSLHDSPSTKQEKVRLAAAMAERLELATDILDRVPSKLSGGQLSRCNLARALLRPCSWLLLDEPFSAVDRPTRLSILKWLQEWRRGTGTGIVLVSHDLDDIFTVATDIHVVEDGRVLESLPLMTALAHPCYLSTARLLRAGMIIATPRGHVFVNSQHIYTTPSQALGHHSQLQSVILKTPQITRIGSTMRIIDLTEGLDLVLPWDDTFAGTLWFHPCNARPLSA
jgi:molybdate transport system ATP-binding protein